MWRYGWLVGLMCSFSSPAVLVSVGRGTAMNLTVMMSIDQLQSGEI